jgi:SAM domain (Sterile alpha motif)
VAAMDEIADWLNRLGMSEYAERFAENGYVFA